MPKILSKIIKFFFIFSLLFFSTVNLYPNDIQKILTELDNHINQKKIYDIEKEKRIAETKLLVTQKGISLSQQYQLNEIIYNEYQKFKLDSAILYAGRNVEIADKLDNKEYYYKSQLQLSVLYSLSGKYRESEEILKNIDSNDLPPATLPAYYEAYCLFYSYYASNIQTDSYDNIITAYRDSLLTVLNPSTDKYIITLAEKEIYRDETTQAEKNLLILLKKYSSATPEYAMVTYLLGVIYKERGKTESAVEYFTMSAIADIQNSVKDNASMRYLATIFYDQSDLDKAYRYMQSAIEDAVFCNVQFRTVIMSEFYSIINTAYLDKEAKRKNQLQTYLLLISVLTFFLIITVIFIYRQMKKVSAIRKELHSTNEKLKGMNTEITDKNKQLNERNQQLSESNHIKEEYITQFFEICSTYINKLEAYRKTLNKKANDRQLDELFTILKSTTIVENELEELYKNFDTIFINIYPTFVEEFNALLIKDEQIHLKQGEILNTELRIFALIRLGITDSVKIAAFLRYSLSTIYNYRTKARNKAAVSRDEFENMVMQIGVYNNR